MTLRLSILLIAMFLPMSHSFEGSAYRGPKIPINRRYFGMHIHRAAEGTPWPQVDFGSWRLWDSGVAWPQLEPEQGRWNFTLLDRYVDLAAKHDVEILLTLGLTPAWASARPAEPSAYNPGNAAEPSNIADWETYIRIVSTRYRGKIHNYELWNEPNVRGTFSGSAEQMAKLSKSAYRVLKSVDPSIVVVSPSPTAADGASWLAAYLQGGGCDATDIIGYHFYVTPKQPEAMIPLIDKIKGVLRRHHCENKPLWNTECGWSLPKTFSSQDEAAAYLMRAILLTWLMGIDRIYWYAWDNHNWSSLPTTTPDSNEASDTGMAYGVVENWMTGHVLERCGEDSTTIWTCVLQKNDSLAYILWSISGSRTYIIPSSWGVTMFHDWRSHPHKVTSFVGITETPGLLSN